MAIMSAPRGTDYILLYLSLSLPDNLSTPRATAPAFTIHVLRRLISRSGDPHHTIKFSLPTLGKSYSGPLEPRRLESTIKICTPHLCTFVFKFDAIPAATISRRSSDTKNHVSSCPRRPHPSDCTRFALLFAQHLGSATGISR